MIKEGSLKRSGFSLIELVFAIVIIAISLMSIPMLLSQSDKGNQYSLVQESVMAARTKLGNILTFQWDNNSTHYDSNNSDTIDGVLIVDVSSGDNELNRTAATVYRLGHYKHHDRRRFDENASFATAIGAEDANMTDIDDFDGSSSHVMLTGGAGTEGDFDYLEKNNELNITADISFLRDNATYQGVKTINFVFNPTNTTGKAAINSTNIKIIELSVENSYTDEPFILRAFSSNIGGISKLYGAKK